MERENETVHGCTSKQTNVESQCRERVSHPEQLMTKQWTVLSCKVRTLINDVSQSLHTTPASALCHRPHTHTHTHQQLIGKHQLCSVQLGGGAILLFVRFDLLLLCAAATDQSKQ